MLHGKKELNPKWVGVLVGALYSVKVQQGLCALQIPSCPRRNIYPKRIMEVQATSCRVMELHQQHSILEEQRCHSRWQWISQEPFSLLLKLIRATIAVFSKPMSNPKCQALTMKFLFRPIKTAKGPHSPRQAVQAMFFPSGSLSELLIWAAKYCYRTRGQLLKADMGN